MLTVYLLSFQMVLLMLLFFASSKMYLTALLVLEGLVLSALAVSIFILACSFGGLYIFITLLALGVCEAGLGLSLLMSYMKITGGNYINASSSM
uniref:NADH dehydrogenase subunit 4L n=1 Tax=Megalophaedusa tosaensis TaxID=1885880 RepID=A0A224A9P6_9EUPU|nr:NADH dehydrogenase subunit 4L [Megalophaedusa tosaensis]